MRQDLRSKLEAEFRQGEAPRPLAERIEGMVLRHGEWRGDSPLVERKISLKGLLGVVPLSACPLFAAALLTRIYGGHPYVWGIAFFLSFLIGKALLQWTRSWKRLEEQAKQVTAGEGAGLLVGVQIYRKGWLVGEDAGRLDLYGGLLRFRGCVSEWALPREGMTEEGFRFKVMSDNPVLKVGDMEVRGVIPGTNRVSHALEHLFLQWGKVRLREPELAILPPFEMQPKCRALIEKAAQPVEKVKPSVIAWRLAGVISAIAIVTWVCIAFLKAPYLNVLIGAMVALNFMDFVATSTSLFGKVPLTEGDPRELLGDEVPLSIGEGA